MKPLQTINFINPMDRNRQKFIITCAPRTGSTMLRMMLDSHPDIVCYGEVIAIKGLPNLGRYGQQISKTREELGQILSANPTDFLYNYVWGDPNCSAIGCKIKYRQLEEQFPDMFKAILADKEIKIIHLRRQNLLKRYVSNRLAASQKTPTVIIDNHVQEKKEQQKITIDIRHCIQDMEATEIAENNFKNQLFSHHVFEIFYEDLTVTDSPELHKLQEFLGVRPIAIQPKTVKVNSDNLADSVENYGELYQQLNDTIFGKHL